MSGARANGSAFPTALDSRLQRFVVCVSLTELSRLSELLTEGVCEQRTVTHSTARRPEWIRSADATGERRAAPRGQAPSTRRARGKRGARHAAAVHCWCCTLLRFALSALAACLLLLVAVLRLTVFLDVLSRILRDERGRRAIELGRGGHGAKSAWCGVAVAVLLGNSGSRRETGLNPTQDGAAERDFGSDDRGIVRSATHQARTLFTRLHVGGAEPSGSAHCAPDPLSPPPALMQ